MPKREKLRIWQWLLLLLVGFLFPIYNIIVNGLFQRVGFQLPVYIGFVMGTNLVFSFIMLIIFNFFRSVSGLERRLDTLFLLYVISVSFGSFSDTMPVNIAIFIIPFVVVYFLELKKILDEFPRD